MVALAQEGVKKFRPGAELYVRPMYWAEQGGATSVQPDRVSASTSAGRTTGIAITRSTYLKPLGVTAPMKHGCLYPNNARGLIEAQARGFDNCLLGDMLGNVAELATANVFMAKDGIVWTPMANGTFFKITRQRVLQLLRGDGNDAREARLGFSDFDAADEILSSAHSERSHRSGALTRATCNRDRSIAAHANFIGNSPIPDRDSAAWTSSPQETFDSVEELGGQCFNWLRIVVDAPRASSRAESRRRPAWREYQNRAKEPAQPGCPLRIWRTRQSRLRKSRTPRSGRTSN